MATETTRLTYGSFPARTTAERLQPASAEERRLFVPLRRLIYGRIVLAFVVLLASFSWNTIALGQPAEFADGMVVFFLVVLALTAAYYALLRLNGGYGWQMRAQFLIDTILAGVLVWETGDIASPYIGLYIVLISVTGFCMPKGDALLIAGFSAVSFTVLAILTGREVLYSFSGSVEPSRIVQTVAVNNVLFLIVGLLAARLSDRRRMSRELDETAATLADLHALHECIVESVDAGLITVGLDGTVFSANHAAESMLGLEPGAAAGTSVLGHFDGAARMAIERRLDALNNGSLATQGFEAEFAPAKDARRIAAACSASPLFARTGEVSGLVISLQDISGIRALEESLRRSDRLAAVGRMAAGLAHEIRNPLGSMSSALQFLEGRVAPSDEEAALMRVVLGESERLNSIITNFLAYARPDAGHEALRTDVGRAVSDCLTLLRHNPAVDESHIFEYDEPARPMLVAVGETELKQLCWNLLHNSIKAMPCGGTISIRLEELPGRRARLIFADTGRGMGPEKLEHLFEPFSAVADGTGLGLSIVHKIVTDRGGRIAVESSYGGGTTVVAEMPMPESARFE